MLMKSTWEGKGEAKKIKLLFKDDLAIPSKKRVINS